jgi:hypothetical protein
MVSGQSAADRLSRAPAGVEEALRARVKQFYDLQLEGKFRQSESCVCEDSKDRYYTAEKPRWRAVEIEKLNWEQDYSRAVVIIVVSTDLVTRFGKMASKVPMTSLWRSEGGNWCYYMNAPGTAPVETPFGVSKPIANEKTTEVVYEPRRVTAEDVVGAVKISKRQLVLKGYENSTAELEIKNGLPGPVQMEVRMPELAGLKWDASQKEIRAGITAYLRLYYSPPDKGPKEPFEFQLALEPIGQVIPVKVIFDIPEDVKKQLPASLRPEK